jgi:XTP/dITP diphosphohydrolase
VPRACGQRVSAVLPWTTLLLEQLRGVPQERRTARFRCVIAIAGGSGQARTVEGVVEGVIADAPRGGGGFGYDPVFLHPPSGKTFGELSEAEKSRVSHRALAALRARALLVG